MSKSELRVVHECSSTRPRSGRRRHRLAAACLCLCLGLLLVGCGDPAGSQADADRRPLVVATTGMIGDIAARIGAAYVRVESLMPAGVDPHLYKATEGDVRKLAAADLILYNGLYLEGRMQDVFKKLERTRPVAAVAEAVPPERRLAPVGYSGHYDPHVWFDVSLWILVSERIVTQLVALAPEHEPAFRKNADGLRQRLESLDAWVRAEFATIPPEKRVLVTAHDAFGYFGRRYEVEVVGLQGISTAAQAGLKDIERVVNIIVSRKIKSIFVESSVPPRNIEAVQAACVARGHKVRVGGELYSDSLGPPGSGADDYIGMVEHNVNTIVSALR